MAEMTEAVKAVDSAPVERDVAGRWAPEDFVERARVAAQHIVDRLEKRGQTVSGDDHDRLQNDLHEMLREAFPRGRSVRHDIDWTKQGYEAVTLVLEDDPLVARIETKTIARNGVVLNTFIETREAHVAAAAA